MVTEPIRQATLVRLVGSLIAAAAYFPPRTVPLAMLRMSFCDDDDEQDQHQRDADDGGPLVRGRRQRAAPDPLDDGKQDVPAVERRHRDQIEERQRRDSGRR